jgi:hypothetical protein
VAHAFSFPFLRSSQPDACTREELAEEAARLTTFAGMRSGGGGADVAGGASEAGNASGSESDDGAPPRPLSALAEAAPDAAALEAHGLAALKEELTRLGMKCGGTLQARERERRTLRAALLAFTVADAPHAFRSVRHGCLR